MEFKSVVTAKAIAIVMPWTTLEPAQAPDKQHALRPWKRLAVQTQSMSQGLHQQQAIGKAASRESQGYVPCVPDSESRNLRLGESPASKKARATACATNADHVGQEARENMKSPGFPPLPCGVRLFVGRRVVGLFEPHC